MTKTLALLLLASLAHAGELPDAPHLKMRPVIETYEQDQRYVVHNAPSATTEKRQRIFDWSFVLAHGVYAGALTFDDLETARGLGRPCGFQEGNPDLGPNPTTKATAVHAAVEFGLVVAGDAALKAFGRHQGVPRWLSSSFGTMGAVIGTGKHVRGGYQWIQTGCLP